MSIREFVQVRVRIVRMPGDDARLGPANERALMDAEAIGRFRLGQHAAVTQSIVPRPKRILMDQIGDSMRVPADRERQFRSKVNTDSDRC
jgi:hypothetical protein